MTIPKIIDVPEKMERFYGKGEMLHPTNEIIEDAIRRIPFGKVTTADSNNVS